MLTIRADSTALTPALEYFLSDSQWIELRGEGISGIALKLIDSFGKGQVKQELAVPTEDRSNQRRPARMLGNLPSYATSFVGRDDEIAEVVELVRLHRIVTLTGVGGVGKTRLAVRVAAQLAEEYPDGVWMVELAPVGDPAAVPDAIATALGITPQSGRSVTDAIAEALSGQRLLVVLDNCEHVLDAAANVVQAILSRTETVMAIATSREGLRVTAEHLWPVPSLDVLGGASSSAVQLFVERAGAVKPGFHIGGAEDAEAVTNICQRLDGIALAIELAAARMVSMNAQELLARLTDRYRLLSGARRGLERHQTLRHAVQWSYDLLADDERTLLGRCAVFAGGFDLAAAHNCCGGDFDEYVVLDLLDALVRKSLVTAEQVAGHTRYRLLETIRQFAEEQLAVTGAIEAMRDRHASYFGDQAIAHWNIWDGPRQREAIDWCNVEFANLREGFRWSADRGDLDAAAAIAAHTTMIVWVANRFEPAGWAEEILDAAAAADLRQLPRLYAAAVYVLYTGRAEAAVNHARTTLRLQSDARYDAFDPAWTEIRGTIAQLVSGVDPESLFPVFTRLAAQSGLAHVLGSIQGAYWQIRWMLQQRPFTNRDDEAHVLAEKALAAAQGCANPWLIATALLNCGMAFATTDPDRAMSTLREGLGYTREHRASYIEGLFLNQIAMLEGRVGDVEEALEMFDRAVESFHRGGNFIGVAGALADLTVLLERMARQETAATILGYLAISKYWWVPARLQQRLRDALGAQRFDECAALGAAMQPGAAAQYAREQIQLERGKLGAVSRTPTRSKSD